MKPLEWKAVEQAHAVEHVATGIASPGIASCIASMTGYARVATRSSEAPLLTLTLKSINHRFLDLQLRLPAGAESLEVAIRAQLKRELARGHIECTLTLDRPARREIADRRIGPTQFDLAALRAYTESFREAAAALGVANASSLIPDLNVAAQLPGMLAFPNEIPTDLRDERDETSTGPADETAAFEAQLAREVPALLAEALAALKAMRTREGEALAKILREALERLSTLVAEVGVLRAGVQQAHFLRIASRLDALVGRAFDRDRDRDRILAEAALLAERGDVEEEIARMQTHIAHFHALLSAGGETGKKLDFLLQEMNREANTLLSKTAGITGGGARITECGLAMKAEIEKLREQVQNLE